MLVRRFWRTCDSQKRMYQVFPPKNKKTMLKIIECALRRQNKLLLFILCALALLDAILIEKHVSYRQIDCHV